MKKDDRLNEFVTLYTLDYALDKRAKEQIIQQRNKVNQIFSRNLSVFNIELSEKRSVKYTPSKLIKLQFDEGWYCYLTDNNVESDQSILTIHGVPGDHIMWAGLQTQMKNKYRWINLIIPGFDGYDERRGTYNGLREHLFQLIFKVINRLKLKRLTLCCFSFGTSIAYDLITEYPSSFQGFINIAGLTNFWSYGTIFTYQLVVQENHYYEEEWKKKKEYQNDQQREVIYQKYETIHPKLFEKLFKRIRQLQFFRVNFYSTKDQFHTNEKVQSTIYNLLFGESSYLRKNYYKKLFASLKQPLEERLLKQFDMKVCGEEIQSYFNFRFQDTGHMIHRRRPFQLSKIMQVYLACLDVKHINKHLIDSKL